MKSTPPEVVAAMFDLDLEPPPATAVSDEAAAQAAAAMEAAEAALAAEIATTLESGGFAVDAPESRTDLRVEVSWPARMRLPEGHVVDLEVRNVSQGGVGLRSDAPIPARTVVDFEMHVPPMGEGARATRVVGTIKTTYTVVQGTRTLCGGTWQAPPAGREVVGRWIEWLRR